MAYKLTNGASILRKSDGACIPADPGNVDYQAFLAWRAEGNAPDPADPVVAFAPRVRLPKLTLVDRLDKAGKLETAIAALGSGKQRIRWDASREVDPSNPDVRGLLAAIGVVDIDAMLAPETAIEAAL